MSKRIGLLGGTFNPVHLGHLVLAEQVRERLRLDEIWFIPVAQPPLKTEPDLAPAADRLRMVTLAIAGHPAFRASDLEIRRGGKSYTVDTLRAVRAHESPATAFFFLVGSDACGQLRKWREFPEILRLCRFVIVARPGFRAAQLPRGVRTIAMTPLDISATDIRRRIAHRQSIRYLVPAAVRRYILRRRLYAAAA